MQEKIIDLWVLQCEIDRLKDKIEEVKGKAKDVIVSMTDEELCQLMDAFYDKQMREIETEIPDAIMYAIHEIADREDKELNKEEVPF